MTRITINVPEPIAEAIKATAGEKRVSAWVSRLCRDELVRQEAEALAAWDRQHPDPDWDAEQERLRENTRAREGK